MNTSENYVFFVEILWHRTRALIAHPVYLSVSYFVTTAVAELASLGGIGVDTSIRAGCKRVEHISINVNNTQIGGLSIYILSRRHRHGHWLCWV